LQKKRRGLTDSALAGISSADNERRCSAIGAQFTETRPEVLIIIGPGVRNIWLSHTATSVEWVGGDDACWMKSGQLGTCSVVRRSSTGDSDLEIFGLALGRRMIRCSNCLHVQCGG
jgi:hypothetical protein